jgi:hypothetical protein
VDAGQDFENHILRLLRGIDGSLKVKETSPVTSFSKPQSEVRSREHKRGRKAYFAIAISVATALLVVVSIFKYLGLPDRSNQTDPATDRSDQRASPPASEPGPSAALVQGTPSASPNAQAGVTDPKKS